MVCGLHRRRNDQAKKCIGEVAALKYHLYCTVWPGSSDPPEKIFNIFESENEVYTNY